MIVRRGQGLSELKRDSDARSSRSSIKPLLTMLCLSQRSLIDISLAKLNPGELESFEHRVCCD